MCELLMTKGANVKALTIVSACGRAGERGEGQDFGAIWGIGWIFYVGLIVDLVFLKCVGV